MEQSSFEMYRHPLVEAIARTLVLGSALEHVLKGYGVYDLIDHWKQGEFHHDTLLRVRNPQALPGAVLVIATNCNGGIKEVFAFDDIPNRSALWHARCPASPEFSGELPTIRGYGHTPHWFNPCELLSADARSELREEFRERMPGGGWQMAATACAVTRKSGA
jgi:hypothetical protein